MQKTLIEARADRHVQQPAAATGLPFRVRQALNADDLSGACRVRASAYGRHAYNPAVVPALERIDHADRQGVLLIAECKETGMVLGAIRLRSSLTSEMQHPAGLDLSELRGESYTYCDRFGVTVGQYASLITLSLMKAAWMWAREQRTQWLIAYALKPLARRYGRVGLRPLSGAEDGFFVPALHSEKYFAVGEKVAVIPQILSRAAPDLAQFGFAIEHRDIVLH